MATPSINDLVRYISTKLKGANWNSNFQKIVNWFTDGTADITVNTVMTTGDVTVGGDATVTGTVTANDFVGDGSALSGLDVYKRNFIINGNTTIKNNADYTLVKDTYGESVDRFEGMATGTAVSAGTLTQTTSANIGRGGYAVKFNQATITGTGEIYLRHRIYSKSAINFKDTIGSFQMQVYHDVGSQINYTIYIRKANALNDFSAVTAIDDSGALGVTSGTATPLSLVNISFGDCTNGIEIEIKVECGAVTLKSFEFAELQLELGATITDFQYRLVEDDISMDNYGSDGLLKEVVDTAQLVDNAVTTTKIADSNITNAKMADNSVNTAEIVNNAVTNAKMADNSVNTAEIVNNAVTDDKISDSVYILGKAGVAPYNTRYGSGTLASLTTGFDNLAVGIDALNKVEDGYHNTALGDEALLNLVSGLNNTALGHHASIYVTGSNNTSVGSAAISAASSGSHNTAVGVVSLGLVSSGSYNTAIGENCLYSVTTGANNTGVGYNAQVPTATASNQVRIGDTNITYAGVQVAWTVTSDKSWKENIEASNLGLDFIKQLKPVSYNRKNDETKKIEYGLIAQDLEKVLKKLKIDNTGMLLKDDEGKLHLRYNDLTPILIKAVQEQDKIIEKQNKIIASLDKRLKKLEGDK